MNEPSPKQGSMRVARMIRPRPAVPLSRPGRLGQETRRVWAISCLAGKKFFRIDGAQWAGAFAFNAFFSLFPLIVLLGITAGAVLLGMAVPVLMRMAKGWLFPVHDFRSWVYGLGSFFIPLLVVFVGLSLFYRLAPRRPTQFAEVGAAALCATVLLRAGESLFVIYLKDFATLNAVYGAFGGIMALLLWIYLSGCVFIFGACLCAGQAEMRSLPVKTTGARAGKRNEA